jgi:hypothetical protein
MVKGSTGGAENGGAKRGEDEQQTLTAESAKGCAKDTKGNFSRASAEKERR